MLRVKELREAAKLTQEALAYKAGVSLGTVQRAERVGRASTETLSKIATALGVPPGELFAEVPA